MLPNETLVEWMGAAKQTFVHIENTLERFETTLATKESVADIRKITEATQLRVNEIGKMVESFGRSQAALASEIKVKSGVIGMFVGALVSASISFLPYLLK